MYTQSGIILAIPLFVGSVFAVVCLFLAFRSLWRQRLIDDLPTSKTQGVFIGFSELSGTAECESPLISYLSEVKCVHYSWNIEEQWSRTITETYRDASGQMRTRTRHESGWKTVGNGKKSIPFYLKDDTGVIRVAPEHAEIDGIAIINRTCSRDDALYFSKGPEQEIDYSDHRRRFRETVIPLHASLYVLGQAREREDAVAAEIAFNKSAPMFIISTHTEQKIRSRFKRRFLIWLILGFIALMASQVLNDWLVNSRVILLSTMYAIAVASYLVAFGIGYFWTLYNSFIQLRQQVQRAWSQVDVELKRRNDLIPSLVHCIEVYSSHERETQTLITELRVQLKATPPGQPGYDFRGIAASVLAVQEQYPALKASEQYLKLQMVLIETEQRIALARDYYNNTATFYNNRLEVIPDRFVAFIGRLKPKHLMNLNEFERASVAVKLAS